MLVLTRNIDDAVDMFDRRTGELIGSVTVNAGGITQLGFEGDGIEFVRRELVEDEPPPVAAEAACAEGAATS